MSWLYVHRHPRLQPHQFYRFGPYEDGETACAVGMILFGPPVINGYHQQIGWYTSEFATAFSHRTAAEFVPAS